MPRESRTMAATFLWLHGKKELTGVDLTWAAVSAVCGRKGTNLPWPDTELSQANLQDREHKHQLEGFLAQEEVFPEQCHKFVVILMHNMMHYSI